MGAEQELGSSFRSHAFATSPGAAGCAFKEKCGSKIVVQKCVCLLPSFDCLVSACNDNQPSRCPDGRDFTTRC